MNELINEKIKDHYYEIAYQSKHYALIKDENLSFDTIDYLIYRKSWKWFGYFQQLFGRLPVFDREICLIQKSKKEGIEKIKVLEDRWNRVSPLNSRFCESILSEKIIRRLK